MDQEDKKLLYEALELSRENNRILRKMRRSAIWSSVMRAFYWILIIAISFGSYYFVQPYIDQLKQVYSGIDTSINTVQNVSEKVNSVTDMLKR